MNGPINAHPADAGFTLDALALQRQKPPD